MPTTTASAITSGVDAGERRLNGPQTTGRDYRNLSTVEFPMRRDNDVRITLRDGTVLLADVFRPDTDRAVPALIAVSPYPRQIQDLGSARRCGSCSTAATRGSSARSTPSPVSRISR